jgi:hypothetical protein
MKYGDCPDFCVNENGTVPFPANNAIRLIFDTKILINQKYGNMPECLFVHFVHFIHFAFFILTQNCDIVKLRSSISLHKKMKS